MPNERLSHDIARTARDRFGWTELRPGLADAIATVVGGRDTLGVMPTGYGKSAIYQVAGALVAGPTIVVSPLIALQDDQADGINARSNAPVAVVVNSGRSASENARAWAAIASGAAEYLFLSPEQFGNPQTVERVRALGVHLFVVDEAHCVSAWGHDFRPEYLVLGDVIQQLGHPTVVALTATGSPPVRDEIVKRLGMRDAAVLTRGFDRPNLRFEVDRHERDRDKRDAVLEQALRLEKPGLIYAATRRDTEQLADELQHRGIRAVAYHAGLPASVRDDAHEAFRAGHVDVVVATTAFGMGIDKADVRFVLHEAIPDSPDSYYQEAGRAGRDGVPAVVTLHYRSQDLGLRTFFAAGAPDADRLAAAYSAIAENGPMSPPTLERVLGLGRSGAARLVNLLRLAGAVTATDAGYTAVAGMADPVAAALAVAEDRQTIDGSRIAMMRAFAETRECRRQFLLGYFGEELAEPCGNCDTCSSGSAYDFAQPVDVPGFVLGSPVRHRAWGVGVVMRSESDRLTVFFDTEGYKVLARSAIDDGLLELVA